MSQRRPLTVEVCDLAKELLPKVQQQDPVLEGWLMQICRYAACGGDDDDDCGG